MNMTVNVNSEASASHAYNNKLEIGNWDSRAWALGGCDNVNMMWCGMRGGALALIYGKD
jgi:hypothetical protein